MSWRRCLQIQKWIMVFAFLCLAVVVGMSLYFIHLNREATQRCEAVGGVTWDSGRHCILGDFRTINTR